MTKNALCVVPQTPEYDFDAEPAECSEYVEDSGRRGAYDRRAGARASDWDDPCETTTIEFADRLMRPVRLLCGDHELTAPDHACLAGRGRRSRLVEDLIHTVWRTKRLAHRSFPADDPRHSPFV